jgi:cell division protein FtsL
VTRVNLVLVLLLVICSMAVITSQHKARKLYQAIEHEHERARALDVEFDQLQIEQSTWAVHTRIERVAVERLKMHRPLPAAVVRMPEQP